MLFRSHATCGAQYQHSFAGFELASVEQGMVRGGIGHDERRRISGRKTSWQGHAQLGRCQGVGAKAARAVSEGEVDRAILICGSGIGMCIIANKFRGVRAALCHDDLSAEMSRRHNDANVMCLSADLLGERLASRMIELWLSTPFEGGRHARRIAKIAEYEHEADVTAGPRPTC